MVAVASRELRNNTRALLDRVDAGEVITITVNGREVAELHPVGHRRTWMTRSEFIDRVMRHRADSTMRADLHELSPDTTDDLREL